MSKSKSGEGVTPSPFSKISVDKIIPLLIFTPLVLFYDKLSLYPYFEPKMVALNITILFVSIFVLFKKKIPFSFTICDLLFISWIASSALSLCFLSNFSIGIQQFLNRVSLLLLYMIFRYFPSKEDGIFKGSALTLLLLTEIQSIVITFQWGYSLSKGLKFWDNRLILGTLGFHTFTASFISVSIVFSFPLFKLLKGNLKYLLCFVYIHSLFSLMLLQCRASFLALIVASISGILWHLIKIENKKEFKKRIVSTLILVAIVVFSMGIVFFITAKKEGGMLERSKEDFASEKLTGRKLIWLTGLEMVKDKPISGHGLGGFYFNYIPYQGKVLLNHNPKNFYPIREMVIWAHNDFLQEIIELGILGLFLPLLILTEIISLFMKFRSNLWSLSLALGVVSFSTLSFFDFPLRRPVESALLVVLLALGSRVLSQNKTKERKVPILISVAIIPLSAIVLFFSFRDFVAKRKYQEAIFSDQSLEKKELLLKESISFSLNKGQAESSLGALYCKKGDISIGISLMEDATKTFRDVYLYENLGKAYLDSGNLDNALHYYKLAMDGGVNYVSDGTMIAKILLLKKEEEKAFETLKGLYSLTKKNKTLITAYSNALIKKNKFIEAVEIIDNSKIEESAELYNLKAVALLRQGKTEDAYDILQKAIMVDKNYVPAIVNMGVVNMLKGNEEVAIKLFNDALKKDPSNETAKINLEKLSIKNKLQIKQ